MSLVRTYGSLMALGLAFAAQPARAFSDLERFAHPAEQGGGGGRYFTGAPIDGFSCVVCHQGGASPDVQIQGLPLEGYRPHTTYEVEISWAESEMPYALHLEAIDRTGSEVGLITLPEEARVDARARCNRDPGGRVATSLIEHENRRILAVEPCGATSVRFELTPSDAVDMFFSVGVVRSDKSGRPSGDGAAEVRYILSREGTRKEVAGATCSASRSASERGASSWSALGLAIVAGLFVQRSRASGTQIRGAR